jgi:hypothetical protein
MFVGGLRRVGPAGDLLSHLWTRHLAFLTLAYMICGSSHKLNPVLARLLLRVANAL